MDEQVRMIRENLERVSERIMLAAQHAGRNPADVQLVTVTKAHPVEPIQAAIEAGADVLGENYPEQAQPKIEALSSYTDVSWHMIGHIQRRKVRILVDYFDMVHSIDRPSIAERLNRLLKTEGKTMKVLLEMNVSGEESKFGFQAWDNAGWSALVDTIYPICEMESLEIMGLMTMPPYYQDPEKTRPYFIRLRELLIYLQNEIPRVQWKELSMGTSVDYAVAVEEGATFVRVGTAILGARQ